jgi:response regulator RpfG family c-di-GMP phosphodiesterase
VERNVLVVAADGVVRDALASDLRKKGLTVTLAANGAEAERVVHSVSVDMVLVESHLPDMSAEDLRGRLEQARPGCRVVLLTSFKLVRNTPEMLRFGAEDYLLRAGQIFDLMRPSNPDDVESVPMIERGQIALIQIVDTLVGLLELEHREFSGSSHQAMQLSRATAEGMGADNDMLHEVVLGSLLRNIGHAGLEPPSLGRLGCASEEEEQQRVRDHIAASMRLLEHIDFPWKVMPVIRHHHECYNGSGFPDGLRGREIPMGARIVAVVDAYVELTSGSQGSSMDPEKALQELVRRAGHQFDPEVVEAFHRVIDQRLAGRRSRRNPRVLIVDSQEQFRQLLKMRLLNEGLEVEEALSYESALERLLKNPPDLALVDLDANPAEAFGLLQELQQDERLRRVPIAFLSQRTDRILRLRALRQGVDDFFSKSDELEEIVARIEAILVRQALRGEGEIRRSRRGITGDLENLSLPDIVQTLTIGMKTACVSVASGDRNGKIWFENGVPRHAQTNGSEGDDAFFEMVRWSTGEFVIEHGIRSKHRTLQHDAMFLLMEGLRLMDEASGAAAVS